MCYNPTTALLENNVREASASVQAHCLNLSRQSEARRQLQDAEQVLGQHRRNLDPVGYAAAAEADYNEIGNAHYQAY